MKKTVLKEYSKLIIRKGLNVQKNQSVLIFCELDNPDFISYLVEESYKAGAQRVVVKWNHQKLDKMDFRYRKQKSLNKVESFEEELWKWRAENLPSTLYIISESPDGLNGIKQEKITESKAATFPIIKPYREAMEGKYQWCIAAIPGQEWAKKVFPDSSKKEAMNKLWSAILTASRADSNPIQNWEEHNKILEERCQKLNSLNLDSMTYRSKNGTNFTVGLNKNGRFLGGEETTVFGIKFNPNIPSEEVYITPDYRRCDGVVYSTKPLSYEGQLIENMRFEFSGGKVIKASAEKNEELLLKMLDLDEGARRLGECALVPFDSPINNTNILFYETLFDENACCHLALGRGFIESLIGYENLSIDECYQNGINRSMNHVDFMIGTSDLEIIGKSRDQKEYVIFKNGNWATNI